MDRIRWVKAVERPHPPLFIGFLFRGHQPALVEQATGLGGCAFVHLRKENDVLYLDADEMQRAVGRIEAEIEKQGLTWYCEYAQRLYANADAALRDCQEAGGVSATDACDVLDLRRRVAIFANHSLRLAPYLLMTIAVQATLSDRADDLLRRLAPLVAPGTDEETLRATFLRPQKLPSVERARLSELHILSAMQATPDLMSQLDPAHPDRALEFLNDRDPEIVHLVRAYVSDYGWLSLNYYRGLPDSEVTVLQRLLVRRRRAHSHPDSRPSLTPVSDDALDRLAPDDRQLLAAIQELLYLRSFRLEVFFRLHYSMRAIWTRAAEHLGVTPDELTFLTASELLAQFDSARHDAKCLIRSRKHGFVVTMGSSDLDWAPGGNAVSSAPVDPGSTVAGDVAFPGKVKGIARLARVPEEASGVGRGHILITTMTTPAFGAVLTDVGGLVTDEGGLLCHAAVIAREERLPCLVGTHDATRVFRTGDVVHLAASEGEHHALRGSWRRGVRRQSPVLWRYFSTLGHASHFMVPALSVSAGLDTCKNVDHQTFLDTTEWEALRADLVAAVRHDPGYFALAADRCYARCGELIDLAQDIHDLLTSQTIQRAEATAFLQQYHDATLRTIPFRYGLLLLDEVLTDELRAIVETDPAAGAVSVDRLLSDLIAPAHPSFEKEYDDAVAGLARDVAGRLEARANDAASVRRLLDGDPALRNGLAALVERFEWLRTSYYTGQALTAAAVAADVHAAIGDGADEPTGGDTETRSDADVAALKRRLLAEPRSAALIKVAERYTHLRSYRISACYKADFLVRPLLDWAADDLGISYAWLIQMTGSEILASLTERRLRVVHDELAARENAFDLYLANDTLWLDPAPARDDPLARGLGRPDGIQARELRGRSVFAGQATGPARIVLGKDDAAKLIPGDIIVSPMTTNDLTAAIQRNCAAIVTDEGGTMSHAAIIAREQQIPCVVGTGSATRVLRDGDIIEVDAVHGIVRLHERAAER